jgi:hypothetical protein
LAYLEYVHIQPRSENLLLVLGKALDFSAADLLENRSERLSQNQFSRIARATVAFPLLGVVIGVVTPLLLRLGWLFAVEDRGLWRFVVGMFHDPLTFFRQATGPIEEPIPVLFWAVLAIFPFVIVHYLMKIKWDVFLDLANRKVLRESGLASHRWAERRIRSKQGREGDLVSSYCYVINNKQFPVNRAAFEAIAPSMEYNLYYLPLSKIVVSIEPLEAAQKQFDPASKGFELLSDAKRPSTR